MDNLHIKRILDFLKLKFPEKWVEVYVSESANETHDNETSDISEVATSLTLGQDTNIPIDSEEDEIILPSQTIDHVGLSKVVKESIIYSFDSFYISVLSGEYISNKSFNSDLKDLEIFIDRNFSYMGGDAIQATLDIQIKKNLVGSIKIAINFYKNFFKLLETFFKYPNIDVISVSNPAISKLISENNFSEKEIQDKLEFFSLLIAISRADHFIRDDIGFYDDLIELEYILKNLSIPPSTPNKFAVVLREKVQYLKYKWEIRQRTLYGKKNHIYMKSYLTDDKLIVIDNSQTTKSRETVVSKWQDYLESHYELGEWQAKIETEINDIERSNLSSLTLLDLHKLIKYYKDVSKNYNNLTEVVSEVEKRFNSATIEIQTYSKAYSYALNNQFSLLLTLKQLKTLDEDISKLKNKIDAFQNKSKIDNFFVEYKYIQFLLDKAELDYNSRKSLESINSANEIIILAEDIIHAYSKKLNWSKNHYHCVFQLPYEESLIDCTITELPKVYYASSFVLPLSRIESQDNFDDLVMTFNKLSTSIKVITSLTKEFSVIQKTTESLKDNDFKSIEVIGVFSAIITFVMASIPAIPFIDSIWKALLYFIAIGGSLGLFLLIIFSLRGGVGKLKERSVYILSFSSLIAIIVTCVIVINSENKLKEIDKPEIHKENLNKLLNDKSFKELSIKDTLKDLKDKTSPLK